MTINNNHRQYLSVPMYKNEEDMVPVLGEFTILSTTKKIW